MHLHTILSMESTYIIILSPMQPNLPATPACNPPPTIDPTWKRLKLPWNHICTRCMPGLVALCTGYLCCCSLLFFFFFNGVCFQDYVLGRVGCSSQSYPYRFLKTSETSSESWQHAWNQKTQTGRKLMHDIHRVKASSWRRKPCKAPAKQKDHL